MSGSHGDNPGAVSAERQVATVCTYKLQQGWLQCFPRDCFRTAFYDEISTQAGLSLYSSLSIFNYRSIQVSK